MRSQTLRNLQGVCKFGCEALAATGSRRLVRWLFPSALSFVDVEHHPGVEGFVAFTIDDAPCRQHASKSMLVDVLDLLAQFRAKATFFLCSDYAEGHDEELRRLCADGHELANHCPRDRRDSRESFQAALEQTAGVIAQYQPGGSRLFRPPSGRMSSVMRDVLAEKDMQVVMVDCYASDVLVCDPAWIANFLLRTIQDGSIALIHMPERGFREWNLEAMRLTLQGLEARSLRAVTVSELADRARHSDVVS